MIPLFRLIQTDWFNLVQTIGIVFGLIFTSASLRRDAGGRRLANLLALKQEHRELWNTIHERPELARILTKDADLIANPMTEPEEIFLRQLIVHVAVSWELIRQGTPLNRQAFRNDVADFFTLPLPRKVWLAVKGAQDARFRKFLENAIEPNNPRSWFSGFNW